MPTLKRAKVYPERFRKANSSDRLKKIQIAAYLEEEQFEALKALSELTRVPQQVYLREGLDLVLAKYAEEFGLKKKKAGGK